MTLESGLDTLAQPNVSTQEAERIKKWFSGFLASSELPDDIQDNPFAWSDILHGIDPDGRSYREHSHAFLNELISFFEDNELIQETELERFAAQLKMSVFGSTANPGEYLSAEDAFSLMVRAGRVPSLQASVTSALGGDIVERMSRDKEGGITKRLIRSIKDMSPADAMDSLEQLVTVLSRAAGWGSSVANDRALEIVKSFEKTSPVPFVQFAAHLALKDIERESENPQIGAVEWTGDKKYGRVSGEQIPEDEAMTKKLFARIYPENISFHRGSMLPVAKDAIAVLDHSQLPQRLTRAVTQDVLQMREPIISGGALANLSHDLEYFKQRGQISSRSMQSLLVSVSNKLRTVISEDEDLSSARLAEWWSGVSPILSKAEWVDFWRINDEILDVSEAEYSRLQAAFLASVDKLRAGKDFIHQVDAVVQKIIYENKDQWTSATFVPYRNLFKSDPILKKNSAQDPSLLLRVLHRSDMRSYVEGNFHFLYTNLNVREQNYLLEFLAVPRETEKIDEVKKFSQIFGVAGLRTFLAASVDPKVGDEILAFAREGDPEKVKKVFAAFGELADEVEELQGYLEKEFDIKDSAKIQAITEKLLHRGRDLLAQAHKYAREPEKLQQLIERRSAKGQLFLSVYRAFKDLNQIKNVTELEGAKYTLLSAEELKGSTLLAQAISMYFKNHPANGEELVKEFRGKVNLSGAMLHCIHFGRPERLVASMLIVPSKDNPKEVEVSGLNVDQGLVGTSAGRDLINKLVHMVTVDGITVRAVAVEALANQYEKQYGFARVGPADVQRMDGKTRFVIELSPAQKQ